MQRLQLLTLLALTVSGKDPGVMNQREIDDFKNRIGFSKLTDVDPFKGVRASWGQLPIVLAPQLPGLKLSSAKTYPIAPGLAEGSWTWKRGDSTFSVSAFVSGTGATRARDQLVSLATNTMMVKIPYDKGPVDLGDLSIQDSVAPVEQIIWVSHNVCVLVRDDGTGTRVEPVARSIQRLMETHLVDRLADHVPRFESVKASPKKVHVGSTLEVSVVLGSGTSIDNVSIAFTQDEPKLLEQMERRPLSTTYRARKAGQTQVGVSIVDRKTMLSPDIAVTVDILPPL